MFGLFTNMLPQTSNFLCQSCTRPTRERETETIPPAYGSFSPLIFSSTGGLTKEVIIFYKRLASLLSEKLKQLYNVTMDWLRCVMSFSLLRSTILCFQGHRSVVGRAVRANPCLPVDFIQAESSWSLSG